MVEERLKIFENSLYVHLMYFSELQVAYLSMAQVISLCGRMVKIKVVGTLIVVFGLKGRFAIGPEDHMFVFNVSVILRRLFHQGSV